MIWIIDLTALKDGVPYADAAKKETVIQAAKELNLETFLKNFDADKFTGFAERFGQGIAGKNAYAIITLWFPGYPDTSPEDWYKSMLAEGGKELRVTEYDKKEHAETLAKFTVPVEFMYDRSREKIAYPYEQMGYLMYLVRADSVESAKKAIVDGTAKHVLGVIGELANSDGNFRWDLSVFAEMIRDPHVVLKFGRNITMPS